MKHHKKAFKMHFAWINFRVTATANFYPWKNLHMYPLKTGRKLNVHLTFRTRPGRLLNILYTFNVQGVM